MISRPLADLLEDGVGIHLASRNARLEPNGARAVSLKVEDDGVHVWVYLSPLAADRLMPDLEANGQAAVVVGRPSDDRSCQVKGFLVTARAATDAERPHVLGQWERFMVQLEGVGIPRAVASSWATWPCTAIRLKATAVFEQTPGPAAGTAIA
jgi:hypothetical protein